MEIEEKKDHRISLDEVDRISILSRLTPTDTERQNLAAQMSSIIGFVEQLNELDTTHIEPLHHVLDLQTVLRDDTVRESLPRDEALSNAPDRKEDYFIVPKVIKGAD